MVTWVIGYIIETFFYGRKRAPIRCKYVANCQKQRVHQMNKSKKWFDFRTFVTRRKNLVYNEEIFHYWYDQRTSYYRVKTIVCKERCKVTNPRTRNVWKEWNEINHWIKGYVKCKIDNEDDRMSDMNFPSCTFFLITNWYDFDLYKRSNEEEH